MSISKENKQMIRFSTPDPAIRSFEVCSLRFLPMTTEIGWGGVNEDGRGGAMGSLTPQGGK